MEEARLLALGIFVFPQIKEQLVVMLGLLSKADVGE